MSEDNKNIQDVIIGDVDDNITISEIDDKHEHHSHYEHHGHHSHHSHHSHHRHHSHKRHSKNDRSKKNKFKQFLHKNRKKLINIVIVILFLVILIVFAFMLDYKHKSKAKENDITTTDIKVDSIQVEIPFYNYDVCLVKSAVNEYLDAQNKLTVKEIYKKSAKKEELDKAEPVTLYYTISGIPQDISVSESYIEICENQTFEKALVYDINLSANKINIYNLKTNTKYFYRIVVEFSDGQEISANGSFKTANTPRFISVDGISNVRDIGGWKTLDGKVVKQGLLYRGTELDGEVEAKYKLTVQGKEEMLNVLGIKFDMDLRSNTEVNAVTNSLGDEVKHIYYNAPQYSLVFRTYAKPILKDIFSKLADSSCYPIYMHCTYGLDRTGTISYLLGALLGVDEQDLLKDYELSAFEHGEVKDVEMQDFIDKLNDLNGDTLQKKVENYLLSVGVTEQEIASIRNIFLG